MINGNFNKFIENFFGGDSFCMPAYLHSTRGQARLSATRGQATLLATVFFFAISLIIVVGTGASAAREIAVTRELFLSRQSFVLAEGLSEDIVYRYKEGLPVSAVESLSLSGMKAYATSTYIGSDIDIISTGNWSDTRRKVKTYLSSGSGVSFSYGVQSGEGGFHIKNTASVLGNVYSNGPVTGENSNIIKGDVISAGLTGLIEKIHATSSAYAHTIINSQIDKDVHYQSITGSTIGGTSYPGSPDQATSTLPISDAQITEWENQAASGGSVTCSGGTYNISNSVTIGPKKIPCDLRVEGNDEVTLTGPLWVTGSIEVSNDSIFRIHSSLGNRSVAVIADNPANRLTGSQISLKNKTKYYGTGQAGSYVLFISGNRSVEDGGDKIAIEVQNSAEGDLLVYAGHGEIEIHNSVKLKEVTGYKITIRNSAEIKYETGLANLLFTGGPSGGYKINTWVEAE